MSHPFLDRLDSALAQLVPHEPVDVGGQWTISQRRTYASETQLGTGSGPFREVVDARWRGTVTSSVPMGGIGFLLADAQLYWIKTSEIAPTLPVDVSLHAYAGYTDDGATFTASVASASLPGVPVLGREDLTQACELVSDRLTTGRMTCVARASRAAFFLLLIQRPFLKMGRKRLWHLRDDIASSLPADIRDVLTRRRTGVLGSE